MKWTYPDYYPDFKCTAEDCTDNCCIGWEIDIDDESLRRYRKEKSEFGKRLAAEISLEGTPHFLLKGERCTFLNDRNLCDLILALGEDALCEICREHPRFNGWYGNLKETGVGLCCEVAAKLILEKKTPTTFLQQEIDEEPEEAEDEELLEALIEARRLMFALLQNRDYSMRMRLAAALRFGYNLQLALEDCFDEENAGAQLFAFLEVYREHSDVFFAGDDGKNFSAEALSGLLDYFLSLEVLDENWPKGLDAVKLNLDEVAASVPEFMTDYPAHELEYEQLAVYFVYRYMLKAMYNCDVLYGVKLMVVSVILFALLDTASWKKNGKFSVEEQVLIVKAFSKEIEYNQDNLDKFREDSWSEEFLSTKELLALLV